MNDSLESIGQIIEMINDLYSENIVDIDIEKYLTILDTDLIIKQRISKLLNKYSISTEDNKYIFRQAERTKLDRFSNVKAGAFVGSVNAIRYLALRVSFRMDRRKLLKAAGKISDKYIMKRITKIYRVISSRWSWRSFTLKNGYNEDDISKRINELQSLCKHIYELAADGSVDRFDSLAAFSTAHSYALSVMRIVETTPGSKFPTLIWKPPMPEKFDVRRSDWKKHSFTEKLAKSIIELKKMAFEDLVRAKKRLKQLCNFDEREATVTHVRQDGGENMTLKIKRAYLIAKLIINIQQIVLKLITFCVTTLVKANTNF